MCCRGYDYRANFNMVKPQLYRGSACGGLTFPGCLGCGPGARSFWAKSIGRGAPFLGGFDRLPQNAAGRSGDRPVPPAWKEDLHRGFGRLARPVHEMEAASWFLRPRSLPPGLAPNRRLPGDTFSLTPNEWRKYNPFHDVKEKTPSPPRLYLFKSNRFLRPHSPPLVDALVGGPDRQLLLGGHEK